MYRSHFVSFNLLTANPHITQNFFYLKYPKCIIDANEMLKMNNGICDGGSLNTVPCGFDDGDCITFNLGK
jgi:hypothetical protein